MQILQWLFKASHDNARSALTTRCRSRGRFRAEEEVKPGTLVLYDHGGAYPVLHEAGCAEEDVETKDAFTILLKRKDSRTCFYSTLNLQHLRNLYKNEDLSWHPAGISELAMGHKVDSGNVGCKVLPICDIASIASTGADSTDDVEKDAHKGERRRAVSRMKDLLRWAAAAKSKKGGSKGWKVLYFRHRAALKAPNDDSSSHSSKIGFRWDVGSCSTSSSVYSPLSMASASRLNQTCAKNSSNPTVDLQSLEGDNNTPRSSKTEEGIRTGQWITTDSDFVVLEL